MIDYGMFQPEFNSGRMYAGSGAGSLLAASAAWASLAAELHSAAASYSSVVSGLTSGPWIGPSSVAMATAAAPYAAWMSATATQAEQASTAASAAAGAYETAFAMTVPPPVILENRTQLMSLVATNFFGQNTPAIAATEAQYAYYWAQDATAMYTYAANSAAINAAAPSFTPAPQTTSDQAASQAAQNASTSNASAQSTVSNALANLSATPASSGTTPTGTGSTGSGISGLINPSQFSTLFGNWLVEALSPTDFSLIMYPAIYGITLPTQMLGTFTQVARTLSTPIPGAAGAVPKPMVPVGPAVHGPGVGGMAPAVSAGMGRASFLGPLSVPQTWAAATPGPQALLGGSPLASPLASPLTMADSGFAGNAMGAPMMFGGLPRAGMASGAKPAASYVPRLAVVPRSPAAGYTPAEEAAAIPAAASGLSAPAGYTQAIVYVPNGGQAPALV